MAAKRYFLNALLCLSFLSGCAATRGGKTVAATEKVPRLVPSAEKLDVGQVAFVRGTEEAPFVLISLKQGVVLPSGARLQGLSSEDQDPWRLKATSQRKSGYQVATIVSGRPRLGDRVELRYPKGDGADDEEVSDEEVSDEEVSDENIPPLLKAVAPEMPVAKAPSPGPLPSSVTDGDDAPARIDPPLFRTVVTPPAMREDVEPRAPARRDDPLELPQWEPDEGEDFMETLPNE